MAMPNKPTVEDTKKVVSLAEQVKTAQLEVEKAMVDAALPIMEKYGYTGFKDIRLLTSEPDKDGGVKQQIIVIL